MQRVEVEATVMSLPTTGNMLVVLRREACGGPPVRPAPLEGSLSVCFTKTMIFQISSSLRIPSQDGMPVRR